MTIKRKLQPDPKQHLSPSVEAMWIEAIKKQDAWVIHSLYEKSIPTLRKRMRRVSETEMKSVFGEAFIRLRTLLLAGEYSYRPGKGLLAYWLHVVKYAVWDWKNKDRQADRWTDLSEIPFPPVLLKHPLWQLLRSFRHQRLHLALAEIDKRCRKLIQRFYFEEQTMKEIALGMGYQQASIKKTKRRCLDKLKLAYENICDLQIIQQ